jgi:hypothetical protein
VEAIEAGLAKGRNAKAIWQDLVDTYGFTGAYQSVKLDLPPVLRQMVKTHNPLNGELSHGVVT